MNKLLTKVVPERERIQLFEDLKDLLYDYDVKSVAEVAGVAKTTIYFWLDGRTRKPRLDTIVKVADALGYELRLAKKGKGKAKKSYLKLVK